MIRSQVEVIEQKGNLTKIRVAGDNKFYGSFRAPMMSVGDMVEFDPVAPKNPKFCWDAANLKKVEGGNGQVVGRIVPAQAAPPQLLPNRPTDLDREQRIVRQNAMGSAAVIVGARIKAGLAPPTISETFAEMLELADKIYNANFNGFPTDSLPADSDVGF